MKTDWNLIWHVVAGVALYEVVDTFMDVAFLSLFGV